MTGLTVFLLILLVLDLCLLLPLGLRVSYSEKNLSFSVKLGFLPLYTHPKSKKKKNKSSSAQKSSPSGRKKPSKGSEYRLLVKDMLKSILQLPSKAKIRRLRVRCIIPGGEDPFRAALLYGAGFSAEAAVKPILEEIFARVDHVTYDSSVDFTVSESVIEARGTVTIQLAYLLAPVGRLIYKFIQTAAKNARSGGKGNDRHGK